MRTIEEAIRLHDVEYPNTKNPIGRKITTVPNKKGDCEFDSSAAIRMHGFGRITDYGNSHGLCCYNVEHGPHCSAWYNADECFMDDGTNLDTLILNGERRKKLETAVKLIREVEFSYPYDSVERNLLFNFVSNNCSFMGVLGQFIQRLKDACRGY